MDPKRTSPGYYIAVVILGALLIAAVAFVIAMIARPSTPGATVRAVTDRAPVACQIEEKATTCFTTQVTNNGTVKGTFHCEVISTDDAEANFEAGLPTTTILLDADQSVDLRSVVSSGHANAPTVSSAPLST